jgi:hypothetical protein
MIGAAFCPQLHAEWVRYERFSEYSQRLGARQSGRLGSNIV